MRSMSVGGVAGNAKMRGKKTCALSCGCCDLRNFKWEQRWKDAANEIEFEVRPVAGLEGDNDNDGELDQCAVDLQVLRKFGTA